MSEPLLSDYQFLHHGQWFPLTEEELLQKWGIRKKPVVEDVDCYRWVIKGTDIDPTELWITHNYYATEKELQSEIGIDSNILGKIKETKLTFTREVPQ